MEQIEPISVAVLTLYTTGLDIKAAEVLHLARTTGVKINQLREVEASLLEKIGRDHVGHLIGTRIPANKELIALRETFRNVHYTTLTPYFLAYLQTLDEFVVLLRAETIKAPSPIRLLLLKALDNKITSGIFGTCAVYYSTMENAFSGESIKCLAIPSHCLMLKDELLIEVSYYMRPIHISELKDGLGDEQCNVRLNHDGEIKWRPKEWVHNTSLNWRGEQEWD
ncbi:hypothetical protein BDD12DRAFT_838196 [Trichophaea hybrida]|nr:hypothetical protein BDD12DRAFT_838196 [Trichophaea hybrida]